jgi:hypothetical protein
MAMNVASRLLVAAAALFGGAILAAEYAGDAAARWWAPGDGRAFPAELRYANESGAVATLNTASPGSTRGNPFFEPIGTNGRACVTCHQPSDGMSLAATTVQRRWTETAGKDPLFAMTDGANCPNLPPALAASHSLLLQRGLFRIARSWPPRDANNRPIKPEFSIEVVRDPTRCNLDAHYGLQSRQPMISVYRRPRPVTNIRYLVAVGSIFEPKNGLPLPRDPETGEQTSGNLMADARARTLKAQALDAMRTHLEFTGQPSAAILRQLMDFESGLFTAQVSDRWGGALDAAGAQGGPEPLRNFRAGEIQSTPSPSWKEFLPWQQLPALAAGDNAQQRAFRESVARGAELFTKRNFLVSDSAGITNTGFGNPVRNPCAFCHNMEHMGMDVAPGQVDLGTTNMPHADPAPDMPLFKLTCDATAKPHPHLGRVVYTQDPGYALTTGRCADIGKITLQQMRGLAARAPYFSNGSAPTLRGIVDFYERRYHIGLTETEKQDLVNLMSVL